MKLELHGNWSIRADSLFIGLTEFGMLIDGEDFFEVMVDAMIQSMRVEVEQRSDLL